jgi:hypothetical protein
MFRTQSVNQHNNRGLGDRTEHTAHINLRRVFGIAKLQLLKFMSRLTPSFEFVM